jgi:tRNA nucleotidyltransferase (CCA-adding enzyme)
VHWRLDPSIRKAILAEITPTEAEIERQKRAIDDLTAALICSARSNEDNYSFIQPQGSTGRKQTQLRGASDIDLFVALKPEKFQYILSKPARNRHAALDKALDGMIDSWFIPALQSIGISELQKTYSQHPYLSAKYLENEVDVLVCFDLDRQRIAEEGPITAVDRTVHHSDYIADRLTAQLREDVRLLKSFVRASHAYGDTCAVGHMGFTGVSLEILVVHHSGLIGALECISNLHDTPLDPLGRSYAELRDISGFKDDFIFIIDPTDTNRNIASSFSKRAYEWVKTRINQLDGEQIQSRDIVEWFLEQPIPITPIPNGIRKHAFAYEFLSSGELHYTVVRDKLYRLGKTISRVLEHERTGERRFGRVAFEVYFEKNNFALGFLVEEPSISRTYRRRGPPTNIDAAQEFMKTHSDAYERDGHLWVDSSRKWTHPDGLIKSLIDDHLPRGIKAMPRLTDVGRRLLNTLYLYVLPVEDFALKPRV